MDTIELTTVAEGAAAPASTALVARRSPEAVEGRTHAKRVAYLDGWRGASLICVLIGHFASLPGLKIGPLGVELFFVLSGRLMAEILFVEKMPLKTFYIRRFSRIYPAMAVFAVVTFFVLMQSPLKFKPGFVFSDLTFTYNYFAVFGHRTRAVDQIWSLCIEEHAYVVLGLIALVARLRKIQALPAILLLSLASMVDGAVSSLVLKQDWFTDYWRTDAHLASVLISAAVYLLMRRDGRLSVNRLPGWLSPLCAVLGVALFAEAADHALSYTFGTLFLATAIGAVDAAPAWLRRALSNRLLTSAGVLSYSIYLWQQPFYAALLLGPETPVRMLPLLAGAILTGMASFYWLEQPARRFLNRVLTRRRSELVKLAVTPAQ